MHATSAIQTPPARVTLRAYRPAPARVELVYRPAGRRLLRTALILVLFWGSIPAVLWVPPHYPWVVGALACGAFLAHREWTGRYRVRAFAGLCPRCSRPLHLGVDRAISLPHQLTCYGCHFEPQLEVRFGDGAAPLAHHTPECTGEWSVRWLADEPFLVCAGCLAAEPHSAATREAADGEHELGRLLAQLTREGGPLL